MVKQLKQVVNMVRMYALTKLSEFRLGHQIVSTGTFICTYGTSTNPSNFNIFPHEKYLGRPLCFEKIGSLAGV